MASKAVQFIGLSNRDRARVTALPKLAEGDQLELQIRGHDGQEQILSVPPAAARIVEELLSRLMSGERVAVLTEDQELSPTEASVVLGISRPLVVHRMDIGDLPFRYVGKHRRALLQDVLVLKARLDIRQKALNALAEDTENLMVHHNL